MNREIIDFLKMNDVEYKEDVQLSKISPIKIGGQAALVAYPDSEFKLVLLIQFFEKSKIKYKILGRMSNVLPPDENYEGIIIRTDRMKKWALNQNNLEVQVGAFMPSIANLLCSAELSGFEGLSGIPGSIGGCLLGNAGAFGREICDLVQSIRVYDVRSDSVAFMYPEQCEFSYRNSIFKNGNLIILSAIFHLAYCDKFCITKEMRRIGEIRRSTQPTDKLSLGSTFRRPAMDVSAAELIDRCGLKGYGIGGAKISEKHAGFIINDGRATATDYVKLSDYAAGCVYEKYGVSLQREVEIM